MIVIPPVPYRKHGRIKPKRAAAGSPGGVRVVSVDVLNATGVVWTFDQPVTIVGGDQPVPQLLISTPEGWMSAITLGDWSENAIACDYDTETLTAGLEWAITEQPVGIGFAGMQLELPQSGVTGSVQK